MAERDDPSSPRRGWGRGRRRYLRAAALLLALTGCAGEGPITDCVVADARGNQWRGSDVTPLSAQETALIACGRDSPEPTSCRVTGCQGRW